MTPEDRITQLEEQNRRLKRELTIAYANNRQRNLELDALHYVWCDGGCEGGIHRFGEHPPLTKEIVEAAIYTTNRLARTFSAMEYKRIRNNLDWNSQRVLKSYYGLWREALVRAVKAENKCRELEKMRNI